MKQRVRLLSMGLCLMMLFGTLSMGVLAAGLDNFTQSKTYEAGQFADVAADAWYAANVKSTFEFGLMVGDSKTTFNPDGYINLAEVVTVAARIHSIYHSGKDSFEKTDPWYLTYRTYGLENGIIPEGGYGGYYDTVQRSLFAIILATALPKTALQGINDVEDNAIPDVPIQADYADAVYLLYRAGIMTGNDSAGTFQPNSYIRRSEVAAIVSRMVVPALRKQMTLHAPEPKGNVVATGDCSSIDVNEPGEDSWWSRSRHESTAVWTLTEDGTLTITGDGPMAWLYCGESSRQNQPWKPYKDVIKKVIVSDGITHIGDYAFADLPNMTEVYLPDTVTTIGEGFLRNSTSLNKLRMPARMTRLGGFGYTIGVSELIVPEGIEEVEDQLCVWSENVTSIRFPNTLKLIYAYAIDDTACKIFKIPASVTGIGKEAIKQKVKAPIEKVYFYGDVPQTWGKRAIANFDASTQTFPENKLPTLYFVEGKQGWTTPTWTAPDGMVYQTKIFDPQEVPFS